MEECYDSCMIIKYLKELFSVAIRPISKIFKSLKSVIFIISPIIIVFFYTWEGEWKVLYSAIIIIILGLLLIRILVAPYLIWKLKNKEIKDLEDRLKPRLEIIFDRSDSDLVYRASGFTLFRIRIRNVGLEKVDNVRVRFSKIEIPLNDGTALRLNQFSDLDLRTKHGNLKNPQTIHTINSSAHGQLFDVIQGPIYRSATSAPVWEITYAEHQIQLSTRQSVEVVSPDQSYKFPLRLTIEASEGNGSPVTRTFMADKDKDGKPVFYLVD